MKIFIISKRQLSEVEVAEIRSELFNGVMFINDIAAKHKFNDPSTFLNNLRETIGEEAFETLINNYKEAKGLRIMSNETKVKIISLYRQFITVGEISKLVGFSNTSIYKVLKKELSEEEFKNISEEIRKRINEAKRGINYRKTTTEALNPQSVLSLYRKLMSPRKIVQYLVGYANYDRIYEVKEILKENMPEEEIQNIADMIEKRDKAKFQTFNNYEDVKVQKSLTQLVWKLYFVMKKNEKEVANELNVSVEKVNGIINSIRNGFK